MPANLTPAYKAAEAQYRRAREPADRLAALRDMLRAIPKHKGTEHLQADIKAKIKDLTEEVTGPKGGGARTGPATVVKPDGAGQIALVGPPNSGKSSLHGRLTGSHAHVGDYPFSTLYPQPGMLPIHDVAIQMVDLPPVTPDHPVPWLGNALQMADGCLLVVDLSEPGVVERVVALHEVLDDRKVQLTSRWPVDGEGLDEHDMFTKVLPTLLVASKSERLAGAGDELAVLEELAEISYPCLAVSTETGEGLDQLGEWLFDHLGVVRVYTKIPGKDVDRDRPYTLPPGSTVADVALLVHRDVADNLSFAKLWGAGDFDAQQVGRDHVVVDGDILELHT